MDNETLDKLDARWNWTLRHPNSVFDPVVHIFELMREIISTAATETQADHDPAEMKQATKSKEQQQ